MRRRRVTKVLAGLAAMSIAGVALVGTLSAVATRPGAGLAGVVAMRAIATALSRPVERLVLPAVAAAGEVLDFKPVPRESLARFQKMRIVRHTPAPDPTDTMSFERSIPAVPETPDSPTPPDPVDRSGGVMKIGSDIHVGPDEVVHGDLSSVNGDIVIEGHVEGDVVAMRGDVELKSTAKVDGDVVCLGGELSEEPGAQVGGQKVTAPGSGSWSIRDKGERRHERHDDDRVAGTLVWILVQLLFGWLFVRFAPGRTVAASDVLRRSPGLSLGIGSMVWALIIPSIIALALVVALLCITIIGIPLALAALVGYVLFLAVLSVWGFIIGASVLGGAISRASHHSAATVAYPAGSMPAPGVGAPGMAAPGSAIPGVATTPYAGLTRPMVMGVLALTGTILLGRLLRLTDVGPLHGFGTLFLVLGIIGSVIATTVGAGALLRSEIVMGTFQRLWSGRRFGNGAARAAAQQAAAQAAAQAASATQASSHATVVPQPSAWPAEAPQGYTAPVAPPPPPPPPAPSPPTAFMPPTGHAPGMPPDSSQDPPAEPPPAAPIS